MADEKTWEGLFRNALRLVDVIHTHGTKHLYWTFGGGTVLMTDHMREVKHVRSVLRLRKQGPRAATSR